MMKNPNRSRSTIMSGSLIREDKSTSKLGNVSVTDIESDKSDTSPFQPRKTVQSRIMDIHRRKSKNLDNNQRQDILGRYLTMTNKLSLNYFKGEVEGVRQEKEEAQLLLEDQKRAKMYELEDITMMKM